VLLVRRKLLLAIVLLLLHAVVWEAAHLWEEPLGGGGTPLRHYDTV
jgi:hypothetical protein